jgi:hypothetical protein
MAKIAWTNSQGGSWTTAADWSGGAVPGSADDVTIAIAPAAGQAYEVDIDFLDVAVHSLTLDQASATVSLFSSQLATNLVLDAGSLDCVESSLSGRLYDSGQSSIYMFEGTLDAERLAGSVVINAQSGTIAGGLTLYAIGKTQGTLSVGGALNVLGSQAWGGGTIALRGGTLSLQGTSASLVTLTLASTLDVVVGGDESIGDGPLYAGMIVNEGAISVTAGSLVLQEGSIVNTGSISAGAGSAIDILAGTLTNRGTITAYAGSTLTLDASSLVNRGAIDIAGGTLALGGTLVIGGTDVSIAVFKDATYTDGGIGAIEGTVANTGQTLRFGTGGLPLIELASGGVIDGGTIVSNGGLTFDGGTLAAVAFDGLLDLSETGANASVTGNLVGRPTHGSGLGTIMLTGVGSALILSGVGTLSGVSIEAGGGASTGAYGTTSGAAIEVGGSTASTYTLAAGSTLTQTGTELNFYANNTYYSPTAPEFINRGAIVATDAMGTLAVQYLSFLNAGSILVGGGEQMSIAGADNFANTGSLTVAALGVVTVGDAAFSNTGKIAVASGGTLQIDTQLATSALGSLSVAAGGTLSIGGTLNNAGSALRIGAGSAIALLELGGEISGGTIVAGSGGVFANGGSLYGVTFEGVLSVGGPDGASLNIGSGDSFVGANGSGAGSLLLTGTAASIDFLSPGPLDDVSITLASASSTLAGGNYLDNALVPLVLGSSVQITQTGLAATFGEADIQTAATITAAVAGGTFSLTGTIANTGTIAVSNGETLALADNGLTNSGLISLTDGVLLVAEATLSDLQTVTISNSVADVTGSLDLQGGTLNLSHDGLSLFRVGDAVQTYNYDSYGALIQGGTIIDPTGLLQLAGYTEFEGVTYEGTLSLTRPLTTLDLIDGSSVTGATGKLPGTITLTGAGTTLNTDTLDNATIDIGSAGLTYNGNTLSPATLEAGALGAHISIVQTGAYAGIFEKPDDSSVLTSAASIQAGLAGGVLGIWGGSVVSSGSIAVSNGETVTIGSAEFVNSGLMSVAGAGSAVMLDTYAYYEADPFAPSSFANAGTLLLSGGSVSQITGGGTFPELPIANAAGADIKGFGSIGAAIANAGLVEASGGTLTLSQAVTGAGTLQVDAGATLQLAGVGAGGIADFSGAGGVLGLAPMAFLGTIAGFASGDTLDLAGTAASAASFAHDSIVVTLTAGGTMTLATSTTLTGSLTVTAGGHGDTLISYAGSGAHHTLFAHAP